MNLIFFCQLHSPLHLHAVTLQYLHCWMIIWLIMVYAFKAGFESVQYEVFDSGLIWSFFWNLDSNFYTPIWPWYDLVELYSFKAFSSILGFLHYYLTLYNKVMSEYVTYSCLENIIVAFTTFKSSECLLINNILNCIVNFLMQAFIWILWKRWCCDCSFSRRSWRSNKNIWKLAGI